MCFQGYHIPHGRYELGGINLARIAYGGHKGHNPRDFLAFWLNELGYDVLAISYPLEMQGSSPLAADLAQRPHFGIVDWGEQIARTTRKVIDENKLAGIHNNQIILVAWSMAGKILEPFTLAAKRYDLDPRLFVSLAATPAGIRRLPPVPPRLHDTEAGYAAGSSSSVEGMLRQVRQQAQRSGTSAAIIDDEAYLREYFGHTPISLTNAGMKYCPSSVRTGQGQLESSFIPSEYDNPREAGPTDEDFTIYPSIAASRPSSPADLRHALTDAAAWGLVLTLKLTADVMRAVGSGTSLSFSLREDVWDEVQNLESPAPGYQTNETVRGNHFFFLGATGTRKTAETIDRLFDRAESIGVKLGGLLCST
ncbi:hypothetical protein MAP00_007422 [Monascus purpureus]|nr:hypothetical protein MAP00_007422 [Monascus purpureus]